MRQGYRLTKPDVDRRELGGKLSARFAERERRDVERLQQVLSFAPTPCLNATFSATSAKTAQRLRPLRPRAGEKPAPIPTAAPRVLGDREAAVVRSLRAEGTMRWRRHGRWRGSCAGSTPRPPPAHASADTKRFGAFAEPRFARCCHSWNDRRGRERINEGENSLRVA